MNRRLKILSIKYQWMEALLIMGTFILLLAWSWGKWPDIQVDFGRELYVPWQLSEGKLLYKDLAFFNGPFSQYFNALIFSIFGVGFWILVAANCVVFLLLLWVFHSLISPISTRSTRTICLLTFMGILGFNQLAFLGNMNFIAPYSHEATHGLLLSALSLFFFFRAIEKFSSLHFSICGLLLGLTFLTKIENFFALSGTLALGIYFLKNRQLDAERNFAARDFFAFAISAVFPLILFLFFFGMKTSLHEAVVTLAQPVLNLQNTAVTDSFFYKNLRGTMNIGVHVRNAVFQLVCVSAFILLTVGLSRFWGKRRGSWLVSLIFLATVAAGYHFVLSDRDFPMFVNWVPYLLFGITCVAGGSLYFQREKTSDKQLKNFRLLLLSVFSILLLSKIFFKVISVHYGIFLFGPALLLTLIFLLDLFPAWLDKRGTNVTLYKLSICTIIALHTFSHLDRSNERYQQKDSSVGNSLDRIWTDSRGKAINVLIDLLQKDYRDSTFVVLPEGVWVNYLIRRASPVPYFSFMPVELDLYGEDKILESLKSNPPRFVVVMERVTFEYDLEFFGRDYAKIIFSWVMLEYEHVGSIGPTPFLGPDREFGIAVLKRREDGNLGGAMDSQ